MRMSFVLRVPLFALALVALNSSALVAQDSGWQFRLRGIALIPDESADISINGDIEIDDAFVPELDISYLFSPNVSAELILATAKHDVMAVGTDVGDVDVGSVWALPPTLLLQYRLAPTASVRPYIGAGINLTLFYSESVPGDPVMAADYDSSIGFAFQGGLDIPLGDGGWFINLDAKKILMNSDVTLETTLGTVLADVDINPWVIGAGIGLSVQ
jgi:outer membrane protein